MTDRKTFRHLLYQKALTISKKVIRNRLQMCSKLQQNSDADWP